MNWKETTKNLGVIKQKSRNVLKYEYIGDKVITKITKGCVRCTKIVGYKNRILEVILTPGYVPIHLRSNPGFQELRKIIWVTYDDGSKEKLIMIAKVIR